MGHATLQLRLPTFAAALAASVVLTAASCFVAGYVAACYRVGAPSRTAVEPRATTELADRFVSVGFVAPQEAHADGASSDGADHKSTTRHAARVEHKLERKTAAKDSDLDGRAERVPVEYDRLYEGWPCRQGERLFEDLCYADCAAATGGKHPFRVDSCTCCKEVPCVQLAGRFTKNCARLDLDKNAIQPAPPLLPNCHSPEEELFMGLCYKKCSVLTKSRYLLRTGMNTCSSTVYGANWTMGIGPCSGFGVGGDDCLPHIPLPTGMGYNAKGEPGYPPMGAGYFAQTQGTDTPLLQRPR